MKSLTRPSRLADGLLVLVLVAAAHPGHGAELSYGVNAGVGYSDNIARLPEDEVADTIAVVGVELKLDHESRRLDTHVEALLDFRDYLDDTFDREIVGTFVGEAVLDIIEDRFTWTVEDSFGQTVRNQFASETPANRENVNHLSTGPDFVLPLGSRNDLILRGRYGDVHYEESDLGSRRILGEVALRRELSNASHVSLQVLNEQVEFDDDLFADFDKAEAFLNYSAEAARTQITLDAGTAEIRSDSQPDFDTWLARLDVSRQASSALKVGVSLGHDLSDAGNAFLQLQDLQTTTPGAVPVQQTAAPFENTYGTVYADFSRHRTDILLRAGYYDEKYETVPLLDRQRLALDLRLNRFLSSAVRARLDVNYSRQEYSRLDREFADFTVTIGTNWALGRATSISLDYMYLDRSDDADTTSFRSNELWLRVAYRIEDKAAGSGP